MALFVGGHRDTIGVMVKVSRIANHVQGGHNVPDTLTTSLGEGRDLVYSSNAPWTTGEAVAVEYVDPEVADSVLDVVVSGSDVTITLATDEDGIITTIASDLIELVGDHGDASELLSVRLAPGTDGSGVLIPMDKTPLDGGTAATSGIGSSSWKITRPKSSRRAWY